MTKTATGGQDRRLLITLLAACAILPVGLIVRLLVTHESLHPDFFGLWAAGRYVLVHSPVGLYRGGALEAFEHGLGLPKGLNYPFSYPPWLLLVLAPLGRLPWTIAEGVFLASSFAAYVAALRAWSWTPSLIGVLLLAPSSAICLLVGQNGFLTAALILGGLGCLWTKPLFAGALLAMAGYKPQFAIILPFILLFGGHWRAICSAVFTVVILTAESVLAFGLDPWGAWLVGLRQNAAALAGRAALLDIMPTITSALLLLGANAIAAHLAQAAATLGIILLVWRLRKRRDLQGQAALSLGVILAAPYAFYYDLPVVTGAALAVIAARTTARQAFEPFELATLLALVLSPAILIARLGLLTASVTLIFVLALAVLCREPRVRLEMDDPLQPA